VLVAPMPCRKEKSHSGNDEAVYAFSLFDKACASG
jgi:hypothetical protein